jgi:hypothetical protein
LDACYRDWTRRRQFAIERQLLNGRHQHDHAHPSIIHFTLDKAASQYTRAILSRCAAANGLVPVGMNAYAFDTNQPYLHELTAEQMREYQHVFRPRGYLYTAFGGMVEGIPDLAKFILILMVRDPRDVLVSEYFSMAYSHAAPDVRSRKYQNFLEERAGARNTPIDDWVLAKSDHLLQILRRYARLLVEYPHTYLTTYRKMTTDFGQWLDGLLGACRLPIEDGLRQQLIDAQDRLRPSEERLDRHVRKGQPGDFRQKLAPETIDQLTATFAGTFEAFGLPRD